MKIIHFPLHVFNSFLFYKDVNAVVDDLFKQYLGKLKDCAYFKRNVPNNVDGNEHADLDNSVNE